MKRKIAISLILLIIAVCCCACGQETRYKSTNNYTTSSYEKIEQDEEDSVRDIRDQKDADDHTPTVYITPHGKRYHKPYCSHAKNVYMFLTVRQAIERGYSYCYYCCS